MRNATQLVAYAPGVAAIARHQYDQPHHVCVGSQDLAQPIRIDGDRAWLLRLPIENEAERRALPADVLHRLLQDLSKTSVK